MDVENLERIMHDPHVRQFVAELLDFCGVGAYCINGNNALDWYTQGRRSVGEDIIRTIRGIKSIDQTQDGLALEYQMLREHNKRRDIEDDNDFFDGSDY